MKHQKLFLFAVLMSVPLSAAYAFDLSNMQTLQRYSGVFEVRDSPEFQSVNDVNPQKRRTFDIPQIEAELEVILNPVSKFEVEVEFEHQGTGSAMEFDKLEEAGEFENETERGGEVALEEIFYQRHLFPTTDLIIGKAPIYMSLTSIMRKPLMYSSSSPGNLEARMIPTDWAEPGVQLQQRFWDLTGRVGVVTGLNSEFFRKYNWIGGGEQRQFENMNFDDPAVYASLEYGDVAQGRGVAVGYYTGNTTDNRRKGDVLVQNGEVRLWSVMGQWHVWRFGILGQMLKGQLNNAEAIANANATLGGLASPHSFAAIGSQAVLESIQLNYEFVDSWTLFAQYEHVDTFDKLDGAITTNGRYDVRQSGWGISHQWDENCSVKLQTYKEWTHMTGLPATTTYLVQFAFDTGEF